jgi:hypothetical protein
MHDLLIKGGTVVDGAAADDCIEGHQSRSLCSTIFQNVFLAEILPPRNV